jgi:hypothetical protein
MWYVPNADISAAQSCVSIADSLCCHATHSVDVTPLLLHSCVGVEPFAVLLVLHVAGAKLQQVRYVSVPQTLWSTTRVCLV